MSREPPEAPREIALQPLDFLPRATYLGHEEDFTGVRIRVHFRGRTLTLLAFETDVETDLRTGDLVSILVDDEGTASLRKLPQGG